MFGTIQTVQICFVAYTFLWAKLALVIISQMKPNQREQVLMHLTKNVPQSSLGLNPSLSVEIKLKFQKPTFRILPLQENNYTRNDY
jgi:hypothetical protein